MDIASMLLLAYLVLMTGIICACLKKISTQLDDLIFWTKNRGVDRPRSTLEAG